jgi:hypothetical protein
MARTAEQMLPIEKEMMGHYEIVYSPDDGGFYASMWWDNTIDSPIFRNSVLARDWAKKHGGETEH